MKKIIREKEKIEKHNKNIDHIITNENINKNFKNKKISSPPKKINFQYVNNLNIGKNGNIKLITPNIKSNKLNNKRRKNKNKGKKNKNETYIKNSITKKSKNKLFNNNNKIKLSFNNYELNTFNYKNALLYDKRTCFEYYFILLRTKILILFSICPMKDYNSMIIKFCILELSFSIYYTINFVFFNDEMIHIIYKLGGKYDFIYFIPTIFISFVVSYAISLIIKLIFLSERNIAKIRAQPTLIRANDVFLQVKKCLVIKYIIFFISGIIFLVFFWMLLSSFGAVYQNTQIFIFENTLISFGISLIYPIFFNIFPCFLRICALNSKNSECLYNLSKFLQIL